MPLRQGSSVWWLAGVWQLQQVERQAADLSLMAVGWTPAQVAGWMLAVGSKPALVADSTQALAAGLKLAQVAGWMLAVGSKLAPVAGSLLALAAGLTPAEMDSVLEEGLMLLVEEDSRPVAVRPQVSVQEVEGSETQIRSLNFGHTRMADSGVRHVCLSRVLFAAF